MSWLNTNTVQGRFDAVVRAQFLMYSNSANSYPRPGARRGRRRRGETARGACRARARVDRPPVARARDARGAAGYATTAADRDGRAAPAALLHRAGPDARRPRRTGDVTMRCIECEEIELARVRDERPVADAAVPHAALDGFPAGRSPRRPDAPAAAAVRRRRARLGLRAEGARVGVGLGVGRSGGGRADQNCLVLLYLAGGNDGLNTLVPNGAADYAAYAIARAAPSTALQGPTAGGRVGSMPLAGDGGAAAGVRQRDGLDGRRRGQRRPSFGLDTLYADGTRGPSMLAVDAGGRREEVQPQPLRQLGHLVQGQLRPATSRPAGSAAGSTATARRPTRCRRSRSTPRCRSRSAPRSTPSARSRRCRRWASR